MSGMDNIQYPAPKQEYKVLVYCATYNQSKYIEDALKGFAIQQTDFPFVCMVMDDASTDGEQEVIKQWMERECDMYRAETIDIPTSIVIIVPHKTNPSCTFAFYLLKQNLFGTGKKVYYQKPWREKCEYEALCEGDDYWIDPLKLQKQVDFLDANPEYVMSFTDVINYNQFESKFAEKQSVKYKNNNSRLHLNKDFAFWAILFGECRIQTLSVVYRQSVLKEIQANTEKFMMGDTTLWLDMSQKGRIAYLEDCTGVYRITPNSATNNQETQFRFTLSMYEMRVYYCGKYNYEIPARLKVLYNRYYISYIVNTNNPHNPIYPLFQMNAFQTRVVKYIMGNKKKSIICKIIYKLEDAIYKTLNTKYF